MVRPEIQSLADLRVLSVKPKMHAAVNVFWPVAKQTSACAGAHNRTHCSNGYMPTLGPPCSIVIRVDVAAGIKHRDVICETEPVELTVGSWLDVEPALAHGHELRSRPQHLHRILQASAVALEKVPESAQESPHRNVWRNAFKSCMNNSVASRLVYIDEAHIHRDRLGLPWAESAWRTVPALRSLVWRPLDSVSNEGNTKNIRSSERMTAG